MLEWIESLNMVWMLVFLGVVLLLAHFLGKCMISNDNEQEQFNSVVVKIYKIIRSFEYAKMDMIVIMKSGENLYLAYNLTDDETYSLAVAVVEALSEVIGRKNNGE